MKFLDFFKKAEKPKTFSGLFRETSEREQVQIFEEAARRANEEQRKVFYGSKS
ncbi:MAG: hypothetical protein HYT28_02135 [Parcubacteria group bacterium]|nr:hypothetical protein [Parcubacteria group bacterium]